MRKKMLIAKPKWVTLSRNIALNHVLVWWNRAC